jgi:hypothetical protein
MWGIWGLIAGGGRFDSPGEGPGGYSSIEGEGEGPHRRSSIDPEEEVWESTMSKEAREELEEWKEKIKQMELVLDMRHAKKNDKQKVIREFLSNMVDPLFPFQN